MANENEVPMRNYAGVFDVPLGNKDPHGIQHSSEAIGGCFGMGWSSYYRDAKTGEIYGVSCWDGVYGGKGPHSYRDAEFRERCFRSVQDRTNKQAVQDGIREIRISSREWNIMRDFTHSYWLRTKGGACGRQADRTIESGLIGYCRGVPVIVDSEMEDGLPQQYEELKITLAS